MPDTSAIILLSGGLDSFASLAMTLKNHNIRLALTFNYGQRAFEREKIAVEKICDYYNIDHTVVSLEWLQNITTTSLVDTGKNLPSYTVENLNADMDTLKSSAKAVWVPNRNGVMLNIAAAYADSFQCEYVVFGANAEEAVTFPDNSLEFAEQMTKTLSYSTSNHVEVLVPLAKYTKTEIINIAIAENMPLQYVWSCYTPAEKHCGQCESCARLKRALLENGKETLWKEISSDAV